MYLNCVNFIFLYVKIYIEYYGIVDNNYIYLCLFLYLYMFIFMFIYFLK